MLTLTTVYDALPPKSSKLCCNFLLVKAFWPSDEIDVTFAPRTDSILYLSQLQIKKTSVLTHYVVNLFLNI